MTKDITAQGDSGEDDRGHQFADEPNERPRFDLSRANLMLPLLRSIAAEVISLSREVSQTRTRLDAVGFSHSLPNVDDIYSGELRSIEASTSELSDRLSDCLNELSDLGIVHNDSVAQGFFDFPSSLDDEKIHWCWNSKDPNVAHWHWATEPCSMRRPLEPELVRTATAKDDDAKPSIGDESKPSLLA